MQISSGLKMLGGLIVQSSNGSPSPSGPYSPVQGSNYGYASGGSTPSLSDVIQKFSFSSDANATDVGNLTQSRLIAAGQSSTASGYTSGGRLSPPSVFSNVIDKFPFSSDGNATDVGDLTATREIGSVGQSSSVSGYSSGGRNNSNTPEYLNVIDKFPFASDGNATDVGDLTVALVEPAGQSSTESGYVSGGAWPAVDKIQKFPFASDSNATDIGDLTTPTGYGAGQSSSASGYMSGGFTNDVSNIIQKFAFASDGNATDVGDLTVARYSSAGQSSTASGYSSGGRNPTSNIIDKFPFASDGNATDVGDLISAIHSPTGQQY